MADTPADSGFHLRILGEFSLTVDGNPVAIPVRKDRWLLALLALARGRSLRRQFLHDALWPRGVAGDPAFYLRRSLSNLRKALAQDMHRLQTPDRSCVHLDLEGATFDGAAFEDDASCDDAARWRAALERYGGILLPDCSETWVLEPRERIQRLYHDRLERLVLAGIRNGDPGGMDHLLRRARTQEPLWESGCRLWMQTQAAQGHYHDALQAHTEFVRLLRRDDPRLNPEPETETLARQIRQQAHHRVAPRPRPTHNLPAPTTSFVGREAQIEQAARLLEQTRLLTLTGAGGCGKTRLAQEVAHRVLERFADGVWWVELASLFDPALLPRNVATVLGIAEQGGESIERTLCKALKDKAALVVLDNCEHLIDPSAAFVDTLRKSCPLLRILTTSRESLRADGETVFRVPSLTAIESVRLFLERAVAARPGFVVPDAGPNALPSICRRLDGLPLAIELAAARVRSLTLDELERHLDQRFRLLTGGSRSVLPRHRTLRGLIDWSYDLLDEGEKALLCRVAVFVGGWTLEAAESVCVGEGVEAWEVLDLLTNLADKSLVQVDEVESRTRYRLLETVRQYSQDRLLQGGDVWRERHLAHFVVLAQEVEPLLKGPDPVPALDRLETDRDNFRAALSWANEGSAKGESGLRLCDALWWFWQARGYFGEGRSWCRAALEHPQSQEKTIVRANLLGGAGTLARCQGDFPSAQRLFEESLAIYRALGDRYGMANMLGNLGNATALQGDLSAACAFLEDSLAIWRELGEGRGIAYLLVSLGTLASLQGDHSSGRALLEESRVLYRELGDRHGIAFALLNLADVVKHQGDLSAARALYEEGLSIRRELGNRHGVAYALSSLGDVVSLQGDFPSALSLYEESLTISRELENRHGIATSLSSLGNVAGDLGQPALAAHFWGAMERLLEELCAPLTPLEREDFEARVAAARACLDDHADFDASWREGRDMALDKMVALALSFAKGKMRPCPSPSRCSPL